MTTAAFTTCSLLPSATEVVFVLGLGHRLVAVTHECDFPPEAARLPVISWMTLGHGMRRSCEAACAGVAGEDVLLTGPLLCKSTRHPGALTVT
jgi:hypothetical protein